MLKRKGKMKIIAKSGATETEMKDRIRRKADSVELQLITGKPVEEDAVTKYAEKITSVHTELDYKTGRGLYITDDDKHRPADGKKGNTEYSERVHA